MNKQKIAISVLLVLVARYSIASPSFNEIKPRLQKILQCDSSAFPTTKKQTADLDNFKNVLKQAGAKIKFIDKGSPESRYTLQLPSSVTVFGQEVTFIENYNAPFVALTLPVATAELIKTISATKGIKFKKAPDSADMYEQTPSDMIKVIGEKYPWEHKISVFAESKNRSSVVCSNWSTDPSQQEGD